MDPRYAFFIWACFGIAAAAVLWNVLAPMVERNKLKRRLSEQRDDDEDRTSTRHRSDGGGGHSAGEADRDADGDGGGD